MRQRRSHSLEHTAARVQWVAVAIVVLATVAVGGAVGALTSLAQDDATSLALAGSIAKELENHATDSEDALDAKMDREVREQASFARRIAIYAGARRIAAREPDLIGRHARPAGKCGSEQLAGETWRVCAVRAATGADVFVAAPLARLSKATEILVLALFVAALASSALFGLFSRRIVRRSLKPFDELRQGVLAIEANASAELTFASRWQVTEVDIVADAFDQLLTRVRLAIERERRFVADASHELRTPLTRILGQLDLLASDPHAESAPKTLQAAQRSCELLARTTESLLALAREDASLVETVDVSDVVGVVHEEILARDAGTARRVVVDATEEALVRGDPQLLRLAASNLIDNALKYTDGIVTVHVASSQPSAADQSVELVVEDEGPGLSREDALRLVRPFARGGSSHVWGTGLGLALVDHVARVHGGALILGRGASGGLRAEVTVPSWAPSVRGRLTRAVAIPASCTRPRARVRKGRSP